MRTIVKAFGLVCLALGARVEARAQAVDFANTNIETVKIADNLHVLMGGPAQGNIVVLSGSDGLFLIDSMYGQMHDKIMAAIARISTQPIRYLVNTHLHGDHTGGNEAMAKLGATIISHDICARRWQRPRARMRFRWPRCRP
jgi:cyclase